MKLSKTQERGDVRADLQAPDGTVYEDVPYYRNAPNEGHNWTRPFITSIRVR